LETSEIKLEYKESSLKNFLILLFDKINTASVNYCVLRNYEELPDNIGNDVDMLVLPKDFSKFELCIMQAAKDLDWNLLKKIKRFGYRSYFFQEGDNNKFIHFDIWLKITWKGLRWADEKAILCRRKAQKQFFIADKADEVCISLLKDLIQNGVIKQKYESKIKNTAIEESKGLTKSLEWATSASLASIVVSKAKDGEWGEIKALKRRVRYAVITKSLLRNPMSFVGGGLSFLFWHISSMFMNPSGIFIVFIGPDGSGKSSIGKGLVKYLAELFPETRYYHAHFGIIKELRFFWNLLRRCVGLKPLAPAPRGPDAIQNGRPHSKILAITYILYYSIDYLLGHLAIRKIVGRGQLVVFDRYFYDYFLTGQFSNLPRWFLKYLLIILPKPDILVYLHNKAEIIYHRKPELTIEQIEKQCRLCQAIITGLPYAVSISTDQTIDNVIDKVSRSIIKIMARRIRK